MNLNMSKNGRSVHPTSIHHHHPYQQPHVRDTLAHFNNKLSNSSQVPQTTTVEQHVQLSSNQGETHSRAKLPPRYNSHHHQNHNKNKNNNHSVYKKWIRYSPRIPSRHHHYSPPTSQSSISATATTTGHYHHQKRQQQQQQQQQVVNETSSSLLSLKSIQNNNLHSSFGVSSISSSGSHSTDDDYRSSLTTTRSSYNSSSSNRSSSNDSGLFSKIVNDDIDDLFLIDCIQSPIKENNEHYINQKVNLEEEELYGECKYDDADDDLVLYRSSFNYYDSNSHEKEQDTSHGDTQQLLNGRNQVSFVDISSSTHYFKIYYLPEPNNSNNNNNSNRRTISSSSSSTTTRSETVAILPFCVHYLHHVLTTTPTTNDDKNNLLLARRTMEPSLTATQQQYQLTTTSTRTTTTKEDDFLLEFIQNVISFLSENTSVDDRCFLIACMHIHDAFFSLTRKQQHQHHYEHHEQHNNQFFHINNFISIFCACLMLSAKFNEDEYMQNEEWCQLMPLFELKQCQKWRDTSLESVPRINSSSSTSNTRSLSFERSLKALNSHEVWILQLLDYRLYKDRSHVHDFVCDHWNLISATQQLKSTFHLNEKTTTNKKKK